MSTLTNKVEEKNTCYFLCIKISLEITAPHLLLHKFCIFWNSFLAFEPFITTILTDNKELTIYSKKVIQLDLVLWLCYLKEFSRILSSRTDPWGGIIVSLRLKWPCYTPARIWLDVSSQLAAEQLNNKPVIVKHHCQTSDVNQLMQVQLQCFLTNCRRSSSFLSSLRNPYKNIYINVLT